MDIEITDLNKTYDDGSRTIFKDLNVKFETGKISVILGKSGVGKSSLLNLISGIDTPDAGQITLGGTRVSDMDDAMRTRFRRRHIGFVFQSFNLIPVLSEETGSRILRLISRQAAQRHKTLVMVTHSREAESYADQVFWVTGHTLAPHRDRP